MEAQKRTRTVDETTRSSEGMHVCPSCSSKLVQPVEWFEQGGGKWHVELRCPECEWWGRGSFTQNEVDRFDERLDAGAQELIEDLKAVTRSNMEAEIEAFSVALTADRILPEDF
jgi:hypothetical protein